MVINESVTVQVDRDGELGIPNSTVFFKGLAFKDADQNVYFSSEDIIVGDTPMTVRLVPEHGHDVDDVAMPLRVDQLGIEVTGVTAIQKGVDRLDMSAVIDRDQWIEHTTDQNDGWGLEIDGNIVGGD